MLTRVYEPLWHLLHAFILAYETIRWIFLRLSSAFLWSYDFVNCGKFLITPRDRFILSNCKAKLTKIPIHLNFIIGPDANRLDSKDFLRIFTYALFVGINCISICDTRQLLTADSGQSDSININGADDELELLTKKNFKGTNLKKLDKNHYVWTITESLVKKEYGTLNGKIIDVNGKQNGAPTNGLSNGYKKEQSLEIFLFPPREGRPQLVDVCRTLFKKRHTNEIKDLLEDKLTILTERIDNELHQHYPNCSDPEMSIIFNEEMCTFGFLPWQTRFTEFHMHNPTKYFDAESFAKLLCRYSRCEQRWGT